MSKMFNNVENLLFFHLKMSFFYFDQNMSIIEGSLLKTKMNQ